MKQVKNIVTKLVRVPKPDSVDLGVPSPSKVDDSALNLINLWFNSADHRSGLTSKSKAKIEDYLTNNPQSTIVQSSRDYYDNLGHPKLYRGLHPKSGRDFTTYTVGDRIDQEFSSWTYDFTVAERYSRNGGVILEYKPEGNGDILLADKVVHSNEYYLDKAEILLQSVDLAIREVIDNNNYKLLRVGKVGA